MGNPPFIGNKRMREALGDGYVEALRGAWPAVPETVDFVMYWWQHAAAQVRESKSRRFGLITTNSITMVFNRQVIEAQQRAVPPLHLAFAIPDHPWVDSAQGAAVRVAMTVGDSVSAPGRLLQSLDEPPGEQGEFQVRFDMREGAIHADLSVGARIVATQRLAANSGLCFQGMNLVGKGFRLQEADVRALGYDPAHLPEVIKPHCNARDLLQGGEHCWVIDFFGYTTDQARAEHPALFQWLLDRVKPERELRQR